MKIFRFLAALVLLGASAELVRILPWWMVSLIVYFGLYLLAYDVEDAGVA